jgi:hypothetical protein
MKSQSTGQLKTNERIDYLNTSAGIVLSDPGETKRYDQWMKRVWFVGVRWAKSDGEGGINKDAKTVPVSFECMHLNEFSGVSRTPEDSEASAVDLSHGAAALALSAVGTLL